MSPSNGGNVLATQHIERGKIFASRVLRDFDEDVPDHIQACRPAARFVGAQGPARLAAIDDQRRCRWALEFQKKIH